MAAYSFPLLIKNLLETAIAQHSKKEIIYRDSVRYDYRELNERIGRLAGALRALGVKEGDVVAVADWDSHRYLEAFFAIPMLGATLMTTNVLLNTQQIGYCLAHSQASVLLLNGDFAAQVASLKGSLPDLKTIVQVGEAPPADCGLTFAGEYEALLAAATPVTDFPELDENTRATQFYTTGTTGDPKGVYFSHRQLTLHTLVVLATMSQAGENAHFTREEVYMPLTPMFHAHAWGYPFIATLCGWKQVYGGRFDPTNALALHQKHGVTFSHCVPAVMSRVIYAPEARDRRFDGWKMLIGGAALNRTLCQDGLAKGLDVYCGYGMSETGPLLTIGQIKRETLASAADPAEREIDIRTGQGMPALLVQLRIVDENMNVQPTGAVGEVVARTPYLTQGYSRNPEAGDKLWAGGWLHTGDIGMLDEDGYLRLVDRQKDVIKSGGEWISSLQLEDLIAQHKGVLEVAVIAVPDPKWDERPMALIVTAEGAELTEADMRAHLMQFVKDDTISRYSIPDHWRFIEAIPRTSVGKIDKKVLRNQFG